MECVYLVLMTAVIFFTHELLTAPYSNEVSACRATLTDMFIFINVNKHYKPRLKQYYSIIIKSSMCS